MLDVYVTDPHNSKTQLHDSKSIWYHPASGHLDCVPDKNKQMTLVSG